MTVVWSRLAERRAADLLEHMCGEQPARVWPWLAGLIAFADGLQRRAGAGRPAYGFQREDIFEIEYDPCVIVYRAESTATAVRVTILTLRSPRQHPHYQQGKRHHHRE